MYSFWKNNQLKLSPWIFLAPGIFMFSLYVIFPIFQSIGLSFYQWDGLGEKTYIGVENYIELLDKAICSNDIYLREKILEKAEDILADEMPITPIYHWKYATLVNPRIKNANIGPIGDLAFERIIIEDEN